MTRLSGHILRQASIIEHFGILITAEHITVRRLILAQAELRYVRYVVILQADRILVVG